MSAAILWATGAAHCHVAIVLGGTVFEALRTGVRRHDGAAAAARASEAEIHIDLQVSAPCWDTARRWLEAQVGRRYAWVEVFFIWLTTASPMHFVLVGSAGTWACSGLMAHALELAGVLLSEDPRLETPGTLYTALASIGGS